MIYLCAGTYFQRYYNHDDSCEPTPTFSRLGTRLWPKSWFAGRIDSAVHKENGFEFPISAVYVKDPSSSRSGPLVRSTVEKV